MIEMMANVNWGGGRGFCYFGSVLDDEVGLAGLIFCKIAYFIFWLLVFIFHYVGRLVHAIHVLALFLSMLVHAIHVSASLLILPRSKSSVSVLFHFYPPS